MTWIDNLPRIIVIVGHYGSGKTNIAVNLALSLKQKHDNVMIVDYDVVNPYYRTADSVELLWEAGINTIIPEYANTNVEIPAVAGINAIFSDKEAKVIIDVGGEDVGALALGVIEKKLRNEDCTMLCVINKKRPVIDTPEKVLDMIKAIEISSGMMRTEGLINNTHLGEFTDYEVVANSYEYTKESERICGIPTVFTASALEDAENEKLSSLFGSVYPIKIYTKKFE